MNSRSNRQDDSHKMTKNKKLSKSTRQVSQPVARQKIETSSSTARVQRYLDRVRIQHTESIGLVRRSDSFSVVSSFYLNPGLSTTFPWLSLQAQGWESYKFHRLEFRFSTIMGTSTDGVMIITPDYDVTDSAPLDLEEALCNLDSVRGPIWSAGSTSGKPDLTLKCSQRSLWKQGPERLIRCAENPSDTDLHLYDAGRVFVCSYGGADATTYVGELSVSYDVELITPQLPKQDLYDIRIKRFASHGGSLAEPFGDSPVSTGDLAVTASKAALFFWKKGQYTLVHRLKGTTVTDAPVLTVGQDLTIGEMDPIVNAGATEAEQTFHVDVARPGAYLNTVGTTVAAAYVGYDLLALLSSSAVDTDGTLGDWFDMAT